MTYFPCDSAPGKESHSLRPHHPERFSLLKINNRTSCYASGPRGHIGQPESGPSQRTDKMTFSQTRPWDDVEVFSPQSLK